jgi:hypothetical protein
MVLQKTNRQGPGGRRNGWLTSAGDSPSPGESARHATSQPPRSDSRRKYAAKTAAPRADQRQDPAGNNLMLTQAASSTTGAPIRQEAASSR